ncbi:MAG: sodium-dependent bicarbonate transport family permease [Tenacibaculum sp.]|nr:sodium-dependent bicarbonate transport family permease [Tenacibaculum sp.]
MDLHFLLDNITNPALLFFFLGILAVQLKSDLTIPENSAKFISLYLLLSIGFKGGQELSHSEFGLEIVWSLLFGIFLAIAVPIYTYFILRIKFSVENSGAIAAAYGSVSAVTFVTTISFLELEQISFSGHMVAVMALMEAPSIMVGLLLMSIFNKNKKGDKQFSIGKVLHHSLTNGSVLLIIGSLIIGLLASEAQAEGIKPFTTDIFKGFLAVFLLDMGITSGKKLSDFRKKGAFAFAFAIIIPIVNGCIVAFVTSFFISSIGNRLLFSILAASASYIAVPAAMKLANPKANPSLYIPMALAITFPFNITLGIPLYLCIINL